MKTMILAAAFALAAPAIAQDATPPASPSEMAAPAAAPAPADQTGTMPADTGSTTAPDGPGTRRDGSSSSRGRWPREIISPAAWRRRRGMPRDRTEEGFPYGHRPLARLPPAR